MCLKCLLMSCSVFEVFVRDMFNALGVSDVYVFGVCVCVFDV